MIDTSIARITELFVHQIGVDDNPQNIELSNHPVYIYDDGIKKKLFQYFKSIYNETEWFAFLNHSNNESPNPMYDLSKKIFASGDELQLEHSQEVAWQLSNHSTHPNIKSGQLLVARINEVIVHDEIVNVIVIIKSESKQSFIKTEVYDGKANFEIDEGIYLKKLDKACLILQTQESDGYRMCIKDNASKGDTAVYWKTDFLNAGLKMDDYQYTEVYMQATDQFINNFHSEDSPITKENEVQIKNKSADYFNTTEEFNWNEYKEKVFDTPQMQEEFEIYKNSVSKFNEQQVPESFNVSDKAVQKNSKYFRSVIKLDKNFHLYVHGKSNMIEKGVDEDGRKFYKLFYEEEQ